MDTLYLSPKWILYICLHSNNTYWKRRIHYLIHDYTRKQREINCVMWDSNDVVKAKNTIKTKKHWRQLETEQIFAKKSVHLWPVVKECCTYTIVQDNKLLRKRLKLLTSSTLLFWIRFTWLSASQIIAILFKD